MTHAAAAGVEATPGADVEPAPEPAAEPEAAASEAAAGPARRGRGAKEQETAQRTVE